jgi:glycosyltransferase involved in cell wall biosynthesis
LLDKGKGLVYVTTGLTKPSSEESVDISVIIPIRDGNETLTRCLTSLKKSNFRNFEVIVVDDCSRKDCSDIVRSFGFKPIKLNEPREAEYARNIGAEMAGGDILVFTDCDMLLQPDALQRIHDQFSKNYYAAVSGVCTPHTDQKNLAARYKNLWLYFSYSNSPEDFDWFILSIGAVKKEVFLGLNGFQTSYSTLAGGGDLEFGRRLKETGHKIHLDTSIQGKHLKPYTFWSLLRNDYVRGKGWFQFAVGRKVLWHVVKNMRIANIYPAFIVSVLISLFFLFSLLLLPFFSIFLWLGILSALAYLMVNYPLFRYFQGEAGFGFLLKAIPLSFVDHVAAGFGVISGCMGCLGSLTGRWLGKLKIRPEPSEDMFQAGG